MNSEYISIVSTHATDTLVDPAGRIISKQPGGPMAFIERVLRISNTPYNSFNGDVVDTQILITDSGEFGKAPVLPTSRSLSELYTSRWTIISTVLDEWVISEAPLPERLFVDLQGYVRDGHDFGKKHAWGIDPDLVSNIYCLKGTAEEIDCLSPVMLRSQKKRLLIVTHGAEGAEIFDHGQHYVIAPNRVDGLADTIGAGDTFLANFVVAMFNGAAPIRAGEYASSNTAEFLRTKLSTQWSCR